MKELKAFYIKYVLILAIGGALASQALVTFGVPYLEGIYPNGHWSITLLHVAMSRPSLVLIFGSLEWLLRRHVWRWRWFHPELDFAGTWEGVSTYTDVHVGTAKVPQDVKHEARIEQDCLSIRLIPAAGTKFIVFESTAVNLVDAHRLVYSYHVKYTRDDGFPSETYGYEEMSPIGQFDKSGRPTKLNGWFAHCARRDQKPVYSGTVVFTRA